MSEINLMPQFGPALLVILAVLDWKFIFLAENNPFFSGSRCFSYEFTNKRRSLFSRWLSFLSSIGQRSIFKGQKRGLKTYRSHRSSSRRRCFRRRKHCEIVCVLQLSWVSSQATMSQVSATTLGWAPFLKRYQKGSAGSQRSFRHSIWSVMGKSLTLPFLAKAIANKLCGYFGWCLKLPKYKMVQNKSYLNEAFLGLLG